MIKSSSAPIRYMFLIIGVLAFGLVGYGGFFLYPQLRQTSDVGLFILAMSAGTCIIVFSLLVPFADDSIGAACWG